MMAANDKGIQSILSEHALRHEAEDAILRNRAAQLLRLPVNSPSREEFEARVEAAEARMDARVAKIESKIDQYIVLGNERDIQREKLQVERDKRIDMLVERATQSAEKAEGLKSTLWVTAITTIVAVALAVAGTTISSFYATQSSNLAIVQTTISAFQQGQNTPPKK